MKRAISILIVLTVLFAVLTAFADEGEYFIICNPESYVWVRRSPKKTAEETGRLEIGDKVYADGPRKNGYVHVDGLSTEWGEGWVWKGYLVEDQPVIYNGNGTVASNGRVACRRYVNGSRKGWAKSGTEVRVLAYSDEWAVTSRGFIQTKYLEMWE